MHAVDIAILGLGIDNSIVTIDALNFRPTCWPPHPDFPIIVDKNGRTVSLYKDSIWKLWPWTKTSGGLNFSDGEVRKMNRPLTKENADLLRIIAAWWLYGHGSVKSPSTLIKYFSAIKPVFVVCSEAGILATDLYRFPAIVDKIIDILPPAGASHSCFLLHSLYSCREELGFVLLPPADISQIAKSFANYSSSQTAYIPPRIWTYQVQRLTECLTDFLHHKEQIQQCFAFCLDTYGHHYGELRHAFDGAKVRNRGKTPFSGSNSKSSQSLTFQEVADQFNISALITKWTGHGELGATTKKISITSFSRYFTLIGYVGITYILNFSMMRIKEAWNLRSDCLREEHDPVLGTFFTLNGATTKTVDDPDAKWVTSPSVKLAVEAMTTVSRLRMRCAVDDPSVEAPEEYIKNPWLLVRNYEPWASSNDEVGSVGIRPSYPSYAEYLRTFGALYEHSELIVTKDDLAATRNVTFGTNEKRYSEGKPWIFGWHQLRRTGAVNMQASELVSIASMQYQLKHLSRAMSLYYGRGYSSARLNRSARDEFVRTAYEILAKEIQQASSNDFISPYGESRKASVIPAPNIITTKELEVALKKGMYSWRPTILGACTKLGACPYGGLDNIAHCGGGDGSSPCVDAVFDARKKSKFLELIENLDDRIAKAQVNSPLIKSLNAQKRSLENVLNVIQHG